jgi:hypothetical protein
VAAHLVKNLGKQDLPLIGMGKQPLRMVEDKRTPLAPERRGSREIASTGIPWLENEGQYKGKSHSQSQPRLK